MKISITEIQNSINRMPNLNNISKDIILNVIANLLPVIALQFIVHPYVAKVLGEEKNGLFLTLLALLHFIVPITSSTLCTVRLLYDKKYKETNTLGDFNLWLFLYCIINCLVVIIGYSFYSEEFSSLELFFICFLSLMWMVKDYLLVEFRLSITYKNILINNIILFFGLLIGCILFSYFTNWIIIFLCGYVLSFIHVLSSTNLLKEPLRRTQYFKFISVSIIKLISASILGMLAVNFDRLLLFTIAGGASVSVFYSASIIGKMISLISVPVSNVFLSYFVKVEKISNKILNIILLCSCFVGVITYLFILFVSPFILDLLYPKWSGESLRIVPITSAISALDLIISVINPIVLRFCNINYQIKLQAVYFVGYIVLSFILYKIFNLQGFAIGVLLITFIKLLMTYVFARFKKQHSF